MKYPLNYYLLPSVLTMIFSATTLLSRINLSAPLLLIIPLSVFMHTSINNHMTNLTNEIKNSVYLEETIKNNPSEYGSLWDFGRAQDFVFIWIRDWTRGIFDEELRKYRPDLLELKPDYETVHFTYPDSKQIFDICWDNLYIRKNRGEVFLKKYSEVDFRVSEIGDTGILLIKSSHCSD